MNTPNSARIWELFCSTELWAEVLLHEVQRGLPRSWLIRFSEKQFREKILSDIKNGEYKIIPPRVVKIPKDDGGTREILVNSHQDRIVLSAVYKLYYALFNSMIPTECVSYKKGIGVATIVRNVMAEVDHAKNSGVGKPLIGVKVDIRKYFDRVPREVLNEVLGALVTGTPLDKLLWEYYNDDRVEVDGELVCRYKSLAQGCAFSALLANLVLAPMDMRMRSVTSVYRRYSDDVLFFSYALGDAVSTMVDELNCVGLEINPNKIAAFTDDYEFLGLRVRNGKDILMGSKSMNKVKTQIRQITKGSKKTKGNRQELQRAIRKIQKQLFLQDYKQIGSGTAKVFSWSDYMFRGCTVEDSFAELDNYVKERLRAMYTGKNNYTHNVHKVPNEMLCELGYVSIVHMFKCYKVNSDLFSIEREKMSNHEIVNYSKISNK